MARNNASVVAAHRLLFKAGTVPVSAMPQLRLLRSNNDNNNNYFNNREFEGSVFVLTSSMYSVFSLYFVFWLKVSLNIYNKNSKYRHRNRIRSSTVNHHLDGWKPLRMISESSQTSIRAFLHTHAHTYTHRLPPPVQTNTTHHCHHLPTTLSGSLPSSHRPRRVNPLTTRTKHFHTSTPLSAKRLIICCDGTGQSSLRGPAAMPTNVTRFCAALKGEAIQIIYYQSGVGTATIGQMYATVAGMWVL